MARDPEITGLETKVKHLETNLSRAIYQLQQCPFCRLSVTNNYHWDDAISDSSNLLSQGRRQVDNIRNSSDLPPQDPRQADNICNIRTSNPSDLPPQEPRQVGAISDSNNPQEPRQVDAISDSSNPLPQEPRQGNSNDPPPREPCRGDAINNSNDVPELQIELYIPHTAKLKAASSKPTKQKSSQILKTHIDELVGKISAVQPITQHTNGYWEYRIRSILSGVSVCNGVTPSSSTAEGSLRDFARITKTTGEVTEFTQQVYAFQQLIFVSACFVLTASGVKTSKVNPIMQLCVSDSADTQLRRLRRGSQWLNEQISKVCAPLRNLAMEYIFHSKLNSITRKGAVVDVF